MTYLTDELRGIDAIISDLKQRLSATEARIAKLEAMIRQYRPPSQEEIARAEYGLPSWQPTERMLKFAKDISAALGHHIDFCKMTRQEVGEYISRYKLQYYQRMDEKRKLEQEAVMIKPIAGVPENDASRT